MYRRSRVLIGALAAVLGFSIAHGAPAQQAASRATIEAAARVFESGGARLAKDLAYFALVVASLPFAVAEAACGAGSTVMIEARVR